MQRRNDNLDGAPPRAFSPRELLHTRGMQRDPVGGRGVQMQAVDNHGVPIFDAPGRTARTERGLTYPLLITNVSQEIFPVDLDRRMIYLLNSDALGVVWVYFGGAAAASGQGMRLAPGGGGILLDNNVPTSRIFMIGTIASNPNVTAVIG